MTDSLTPIVVVAGPTASGKTRVATELALHFDGELVGADSVQVYRGFDIGSAKPKAAELQGVPHHMLDVAEPTEAVDAAWYARKAGQVIDEVRGRDKLPIVVGGTGLWLRALLRGLVPLPPVDRDLRAELESLAKERGGGALHARLERVDPTAAGRIHANDMVRTVRALEVYMQTGRALSDWQAEHALGGPRYRTSAVVLRAERAALRRRIDDRTTAMWAAGWVAEVRALLKRYGPQIRPMRSVGYAQVAHLAQGTLQEAEAQREAARATWLYARRQNNWFRREAGFDWWAEADEVLSPAGLAALEQRLA